MAEEYPLSSPVIDAGRQLAALDSHAAIWSILPSLKKKKKMHGNTPQFTINQLKMPI